MFHYKPTPRSLRFIYSYYIPRNWIKKISKKINKNTVQLPLKKISLIKLEVEEEILNDDLVVFHVNLDVQINFILKILVEQSDAGFFSR